jgi:hypothetical protein
MYSLLIIHYSSSAHTQAFQVMHLSYPPQSHPNHTLFSKTTPIGQNLTGGGFHRKYRVEKKKMAKIWVQSGKMCYFVSINSN